MRRRIVVWGAFAVMGLSAAAAGAGAASGQTAQGTPPAPSMRKMPADRAGFRRLDEAIGRKSAVRPEYLRRDSVFTATVVLAGDSVADAVISEREQGRSLGRPERAAKRGSVAAAQAPLVRQVRATGATVLYTLQDAISAVVVRGTQSQLDAIARLSGVVAVQRSHRVERDNTTANAVTGASTAWEELSVTGAGQTIAIIDTGVDYTHATFGGSGSAADYTANDRTTIEPDSFPTVKVVGGYDFVGDDYDASSDVIDRVIPQPDPDPLDCGGHGTHVAGTAAGYGVNVDGSTYTGAYTKDAVASLKIGPGSAPGASILAYKVFGCEGSVETAIVIAALDRALRDGATVANLSLGAGWTLPDYVESKVVNRVSRAGLLVVASAGNEGNAPYNVGSPGVASRALTVAALDAKPSYPAATLTLPSTSTLPLLDINDRTFSFSAPVVVLSDGHGGIGLGCAQADYSNAVVGAIVVTKRGECARVDRAIFGATAGAAAVIMVNNGPGYPVFDGPIAGVSIPFLGALESDAIALQGLDGVTVPVASSGTIPNEHYLAPADFTSGGPRLGDSAQKPEISAPGVALFSAAVGTGNDGVYESGTSMAAPHTTGIAALVRAAHPTWSPAEVKAAIINTAITDGFQDYNLRVQGSGVVSAVGAVAATTTAVTEDGLNTLSFGFESSRNRIESERRFTLVNHASYPVGYAMSIQVTSDQHGARFRIEPSYVVVPAGGKRNVKVRLTLDKSAVHDLPGASLGEVPADDLTTVRGVVLALPVWSPTLGAAPNPPVWNAVRVPYLLVPHAESDVEVGGLRPVSVRKPGSDYAIAKVKNHGAHDGNADVYAWQLSDRKGDATPAGDILSVGVQTFDASGDEPDRFLVMAVQFAGQRNTGAASETDIVLDTNDDGVPDHLVFGIDSGLVLDGYPNGQFGVFVMRLEDETITGAWLGDAPYNGSVALLPFLASEVGMTASSPALHYAVASFDFVDFQYDEVPGAATWNPFTPAVETGQWVTVPAGASDWIPFSDLSRKTGRALGIRGYLVVTLDDRAGDKQVDRVELR